MNTVLHHHWPFQADHADAVGQLHLYDRGRLKRQFGKNGVDAASGLRTDEVDVPQILMVSKPFTLSFWAVIESANDDASKHDLVSLGGGDFNGLNIYYDGEGNVISRWGEWAATASLYQDTSGASGTPVEFTANDTYVATTEQAIVECWGAGGGASSNVIYGEIAVGSGYGGGGGAYSKSTVTLTLGDSYAIAVGAGGGGGSGTNSGGTDGGESYFGSETLVMAKGGKGGGYYSGGTGGDGGASAEGYGDVKYSGGNGGAAVGGEATGGGGGSSAGTASDGNNGADADVGGGTTLGGAAPTGGAKGGDCYAFSSPENGAFPGGGGAGGKSSIDGASGAAGKVVVTPILAASDMKKYRKWTHICATYDGSGVPAGLKLYVNANLGGVGVSDA